MTRAGSASVPRPAPRGAALLALLVVSACAAPPAAAPPPAPSEEAAPDAAAPASAEVEAALEAAYRRAVEDAALAEPHEVHPDLIALVEGEPGLEWKGPPGDRRVLLSTWTSWDGYAPRLGGSLELARPVWVTVPAELRPLLQGVPPAGRALRLKQALGLPPRDAKTTLVELWVRPADVFRPAPDPEVSDHVAELDFPPGVPDAHRQWFEDLRARSYGDPGYPWTRLGYTYDWADPAREVGLSEFVIRAGAPVEVHSVCATEEYGR